MPGAAESLGSGPTLEEKLSSGVGREVARYKEMAIRGVLFLAAFLAIVVTGAIFYVLLTNSLTFFEDVSVIAFLTGTNWEPVSGIYGILPLINGTLMVTVGSSLFAIPLGLATAIYLSEFASRRVRGVLKPTIEMLASVPSIVFGFFAVVVISPILQQHLGAEVFNALNAVIVLTFMVLPIITSIAEDAISAVPEELKHGALALGATKWEVATKVTTPAALSGIIAGSLLGFARAIGETMAVTLAAGARPSMAIDFLASIQTMTAYIAQTAQGDIVQAGPRFYSLYAVGLVLFVITFVINVGAQRIIRRYQEVYE